jgi:hypothetical protein
MQIQMSIIEHGDACWPDLATKHIVDGKIVSVAMLKGGMVSGKPSVTFRITSETSTNILAQISLEMLTTVVNAFNAAHGDHA